MSTKHVQIQDKHIIEMDQLMRKRGQNEDVLRSEILSARHSLLALKFDDRSLRKKKVIFRRKKIERRTGFYSKKSGQN